MPDLHVLPSGSDDDNENDPVLKSPALLRYYGSELRRYREAAGLTQGELGKRINCSKGKVSLLETGQSNPLEPTRQDKFNSPLTRQCDEVLDTDGALSRILPLLEETDKAYPDWFQPFPKLEAQARELYSFEPQAVPGLLQTEGYAHAQLSAHYPPISETELEEQVQARLKRQKVLRREDPPLLWFVLDEAVLRRPIGGTEVFAAQLDKLLATRENRWITLQVLPFARGEHSLMNGSLVILQLAKDRLLYVEGTGSATITGTESDVANATLTYKAACARALSEDESLQLIAEIRGTLCR